MIKPYRIIIKNGVWYRELNPNFKSVNFPCQVVHHDKMVPFGKFFVHSNLFGYRSFQIRHQVHSNNPFNGLITVQLPQTDEINIPSRRTIQ